jgi:hypothetical protein
MQSEINLLINDLKRDNERLRLILIGCKDRARCREYRHQITDNKREIKNLQAQIG